MHVLIVTPWYPPSISGAGEYLSDIADGLVEGGHQVTVLVGQDRAGDVKRRGARVIVVHGAIRGSTSLKLLSRGISVDRHDRVDVVVAGGVHPAGTVGALLAGAIGARLSIVAFGEDASIARSSHLARTCLPRVCRRAACILAASSFTSDELARHGCAVGRCHVVNPAIHAERFDAVGVRRTTEFRRTHSLEGRRVVLTVARLDERKGHDVTLRALASLTAEFDDIHYLIVGTGDQTRLRTLARELGMSDRLTIIEHLDVDELSDAYAAADLFVMVSRPDDRDQVEGFGTVYVEAAAVGLPVVSGNMGGCTDAVIDGVTGLCVDPRDSVSVADAVRTILSSPSLARALGTKGKARALSEFDQQSFKASVVGLLEGVPAPFVPSAIGAPGTVR